MASLDLFVQVFAGKARAEIYTCNTNPSVESTEYFTFFLEEQYYTSLVTPQ